ncbi:hypothetical protein F2Q70_00010286 [Brassica cretica]|uniref:Arabidopsis retrotransposon Orf1 C-terminal domain-containing protein n=1 Tax=Brassica cretica TaxID=69181 RepID=A0A8S9LXM2_BRACR|nr:hypothetical protein F2Q70_00010286 [Brassica cretica]
MNARSLRSDRASARARSLHSGLEERTLGRYQATELRLELGRYVANERDIRSVATIRTKFYLGNIRCDVLLIEHDLLRKDILVFCGDLDVNFIVTIFDPNKIQHASQHRDLANSIRSHRNPRCSWARHGRVRDAQCNGDCAPLLPDARTLPGPTQRDIRDLGQAKGCRSGEQVHSDVALLGPHSNRYRIIRLQKGVSVPDQKPYVEGNAKMVSNLLFAKDQTSKVTKGELQMLYSGLEDEIRRSQAGIPFQLVQTDPGFHLIWMFYTRKDFLLRTDNKKGRCGSLLTPLFKHFRINLQAYAVNYNIEYVDTPHLISCHILHDETTYRFTDKEGNMLFIKLPQPHLTNINTNVFEMLNAMGIAPLCYQTHELYRDLVRQVLATAHIGYYNPQACTYENCSFSVMADGNFCSLSLDQLNEIYEILDERKDVAVENKFTQT